MSRRLTSKNPEAVGWVSFVMQRERAKAAAPGEAW